MCIGYVHTHEYVILTIEGSVEIFTSILQEILPNLK